MTGYMIDVIRNLQLYRSEQYKPIVYYVQYDVKL